MKYKKQFPSKDLSLMLGYVHAELVRFPPEGYDTRILVCKELGVWVVEVDRLPSAD